MKFIECISFVKKKVLETGLLKSENDCGYS